MGLKALRTERKLTQKTLAKKSDMAQSTIHYLETGKQSPTERTLKKLATALEVDIAELISAEEAELQRR